MGTGNDPGGGDDVGEFSSSGADDVEGPDDGVGDRPEVGAQGGVDVFSRESDEEGTCWAETIVI